MLGNSGFWVAPRDEEALCVAMTTLLGDPSVRERKARAAKVAADSLSWDRAAASTTRALCELVA